MNHNIYFSLKLQYSACFPRWINGYGSQGRVGNGNNCILMYQHRSSDDVGEWIDYSCHLTYQSICESLNHIYHIFVNKSVKMHSRANMFQINLVIKTDFDKFNRGDLS